jgi:hypothetical protein
MNQLAVAIVTSIALLAGGVSAATVGITEGTRDLVDGTSRISGPDASPLPGGAYDLDGLGTLGPDTFEIFGRIVDSIDNFSFGFTAASSFDISWIFGGYDLAGGGFVAESGFVSEGISDKTATFRLLEDLGGGSFSLVDFADFTTDVTSGPEVIFSAGPGNYVFQVDGSGSNASGSGVGLYDIRISAVPLPAAGWLLLAGVGGLVAVRRRKNA